MRVEFATAFFDCDLRQGVGYSLTRNDAPLKRHAISFDPDDPKAAICALRALADHLEKELRLTPRPAGSDYHTFSYP